MPFTGRVNNPIACPGLVVGIVQVTRFHPVLTNSFPPDEAAVVGVGVGECVGVAVGVGLMVGVGLS